MSNSKQPKRKEIPDWHEVLKKLRHDVNDIIMFGDLEQIYKQAFLCDIKDIVRHYESVLEKFPMQNMKNFTELLPPVSDNDVHNVLMNMLDDFNVEDKKVRKR